MLLIRWLATTPGARIAYELTGPYHRAIEHALAMAGRPLAKVKSPPGTRFAEATGKLVKTDSADAAMVARMGVAWSRAYARSQAKNWLASKSSLCPASAHQGPDSGKNREKIVQLPLLKNIMPSDCTRSIASLSPSKPR